MGISIHAVLEQRSLTNEWKTVLLNCMQYRTSEIRSTWADIVEEYFYQGLPPNFDDKCYVGEYGHAYLTLDKFLKIKPRANETNSFSVNIEGNRVVVEIVDPEEHWVDPNRVLREYQTAIKRMIETPDEYRLVVGFS